MYIIKPGRTGVGTRGHYQKMPENGPDVMIQVISLNINPFTHRPVNRCYIDRLIHQVLFTFYNFTQDMNSPLIHIGYPKSGTTWFQNNFYPRVRNAVYIPRKDVQDHIIRPYAIGFDADASLRFFNQQKENSIIICEELLLASVRSGGFNGFVTKEIGHRLKSIFPEARIVIFIRNQIDLIASAYGQYIKGGGREGIDDYLFHSKARFYVDLFQFSFKYLEYDRIMQFYQDLFGERLHIFTFEKFVRDSSGFLVDFANVFKLDINVEELDMEPRNKRLNTPTYTRWRNRLRIPPKLSLSNLTGGRFDHESVFTSRKSPEEILGPKNTNYIQQYYRESNQKLIDLFGLEDIREYGYPLGPEERA
jgi:hypothetical protein